MHSSRRTVIRSKDHKRCGSVIARRRLSRGIITAWSIFGLLLAGLCAALLFNQLRISAVRDDSLRCAEAAALAAAKGLLSDDLLKAEQQPVEQQWRIARSQDAAIRLSEFYARSRPLLPLTADDIRYHYRGYSLQKPAGDVDSAIPDSVTAGYGLNGSTRPLPLLLAGLTGIHQASVGVQATARLENHLIGFQPSDAAPIPLMPFAVRDGSSDTPTSGWAAVVEQNSGPDLFAWSAESRQVTSGPDGLPEITLSLSAATETSGSGSLIPLRLCRDPWNQDSDNDVNMARQIRTGITGNDLRSIGLSDLRFPYSAQVIDIPRPRLAAIGSALQDMTGQPVIWCLCQTSTEANDTTSGQVETLNSELGSTAATLTTLTRPAAARIVRVRSEESGRIEITLQPCVVTTTTSVTDASQQTHDNRYVYRIRLVQ